MKGAVSKVNKKFIFHLTRAKRTPSAAATLLVSHALPAVRSLVLTAGSVSKMASQQEKAFCVLHFEVSSSVITVQRAVQCTVITDLDTPNGAHRKLFPAAAPSWKLAPQPRSKHERANCWERMRN